MVLGYNAAPVPFVFFLEERSVCTNIVFVQGALHVGGVLTRFQAFPFAGGTSHQLQAGPSSSSRVREASKVQAVLWRYTELGFFAHVFYESLYMAVRIIPNTKYVTLEKI